jgi:hypothetical protein
VSNSDKSDIRQEIKLTNIEQLYQIKDENGQPIAYEEVDGRQLFNHYRHNLTNLIGFLIIFVLNKAM